ncbi:MAG: PQQ-dependent dehydrogenase, methanol/ethanol family, partial [Bryobacteraceae bacterium]
FSVLVMDMNEGIHSIPKGQISKTERLKASLMTAPKLRASEVEDLVALLTAEAPPAIPLPEWKPTASLNLTASRIQKSRQEPANWLTYWGHYDGSHYSLLNSITPANVTTLASQWTWQLAGTNVETTPIVADGIMYITGPKNDAAALDARTGLPLWRYTRRLPAVHSQCTVMTNRGFAMLGDRLYLGTLDAHLVSLDARTGSVIWDVAVEDFEKGFSITEAPLAIDCKIIVGITSGECALTGFIDAYDAATGKRIWRVPTVAQPGDPNRASWSGDSAKYGGSPTWMTGTFDAASNTLYWTTGNPGPDFDGSVRQGDNLYSDCVLALDPATGNRKWYFQFTQHDTHDWDANETPVLIDAVFEGKPRKLLIQANRNAFYYVLDRETGQFLAGRAFARQTWAKGLDANGHPIVIPNTDPTPEGVRVCPDASGATNWAAPSYDAGTKLFYVSVREVCAVYTSITRPPAPGESYTGGGSAAEQERETPGSIRALDPLTGKTVWNFPMQSGSAAAGVLSTAGGVLFAATSEGNLIALNAKTGAPLWHYQVGGAIQSAPISYAVDGRQYIAIATDSTLVTFALPEAVTRPGNATPESAQ